MQKSAHRSLFLDFKNEMTEKSMQLSLNAPLKTLLNHTQKRVPSLLAFYVFGSYAQANATTTSDLDLAVLVPTYVDPILLFELSGELSEMALCAVDLLDLRASSTVMQYQIITTGVCVWRKNSASALFEAAILSDKTELDCARANLLRDIKKEGVIYGR